ncbi:hypothetical protein CYANOKiyG1_05090 [Okeania sp. KiyG1]|nr:hypothetical protein CYANOKiyG1_05090 [Okeania sp. KiyG1]
MYPEDYIDRDSIFDIDLSICKVAPEDKETAVFKQLVDQEKFGVVPFFRKETLLSVKAWDEAYIGWGAEDQDLIERYTKNCYFLRSPKLIYIHLNHSDDLMWKEDHHIEKNRKYYYKKEKFMNYKLFKTTLNDLKNMFYEKQILEGNYVFIIQEQNVDFCIVISVTSFNFISQKINNIIKFFEDQQLDYLFN